MAYAAVVSVIQILDQILHPHLQKHHIPHQKQQFQCLLENFSLLQNFLEDSWQKSSTCRVVQCLERKIRDASYRAEDIVESHISMHFHSDGIAEREMRYKIFCQQLEIVANEIHSIKIKVSVLIERWAATDRHQKRDLAAGLARLASSGKNTMVGFDDYLMKIIHQLTSNEFTLQIIPIVGMGGIGKTLLARNVYNDPWIEYHFDTRAWVTISQEYGEREILLSLLDSMKKLTAPMRQEDDEQLKKYLYQSLKGRRFLIVMDDVWNTNTWDFLKRLFPDDRTGSRIILTTRLSAVAIYDNAPTSCHHINFLNDDDSWILLRQKVFAEGCCPGELEEAGKKIAQNCKGLPLAIVVIGGVLSKARRTKHHWEYVAENVKSVVTASDSKLSAILDMSYNYLPHYLKSCFLYMGAFPEDYEIPVSKLIKLLWTAEGFLKPVRDKSSEEVAEEHLEDLISRNLVLICEKRSNGKIKTCGIHDLLRDLCLRKADEEKLFHVMDTHSNRFYIAASLKYSSRFSS